MTSVIKNPKDVPVSTFLGVSLIIIFLLFNAKILTSLPCGKSIHEVFMSNFVHVDTLHIIFNLYALYALSRVEEELGFKSFIWLIIFLLIFNTLAEYLAKNIWKDMKCSIGFSGILFGIMTWEIVSQKKFDLKILAAIVVMVLSPSIKNKRASLLGHGIGAISGVVGALIWKYLNGIKH